MTQQLLTHCMLLHIHRDKTDDLNLKEMASKFIQINDRRIGYFGQY